MNVDSELIIFVDRKIICRKQLFERTRFNMAFKIDAPC